MEVETAYLRKKRFAPGLIFLAAIAVLLGLGSLDVSAMGGSWVTAKILSYEKPNYRIVSNRYEYVVDAGKINPAAVKKFRTAKKTEPVTFLLPNNAIVSKKKVKAPAATKGHR